MVPDALASVVDVRWFGTNAIELTYTTPDGGVAQQLLYRDDEPRLRVAVEGRPWTFDGDGAAFRLVSEAKRIHLAYLFDPFVAVTTSLVDPLPHQITAVYEEMLPRQPLNYLLADDPGAGKTIMTGLLIRELVIRGDLRRCLIVVPGALVEQWQQELDEKFKLPFDILTRDRIEGARSGNPFAETDLLIARLDTLARDEELQGRLDAAPDWDLLVFDEAHKLAATLQGDEVRKTKRRLLAERLRPKTRHLLLLTATPHSGKEDDFALFMGLLDPDRFAGHRRTKATGSPPAADADDLMRRLVKESLVTFEGHPLFPRREAFVVPYELSAPEAALYEQVTRYVREEMNRAERLKEKGETKRGLIVGFALTVLQRRLASSPEAIYQSLRRRRERLERKLAETELLRQGAEARIDAPELAALSLAGLEGLEADEEAASIDEDDATAAETEAAEEQLIDLATAASTIAELRTEIASLTRLEALAAEVRGRGTDTKWRELAALIADAPEMHDAGGARRKLVVFTEHRDTLTYLVAKLRALIGRDEAVVAIHGGLPRDARRAAEQAFTHDPDVLILVATDAAGEGINLQRAHLMVNYDLPWNPNRLEQRFGRIHRIGQHEVCYLWNLVAHQTVEGAVYQRLLEKLAVESEALGGAVFDVLGRLTFGDKPLRQLLIEAIRAADTPAVRAELDRVVAGAVDRAHLQALLDERGLGADVLDARRVAAVREQMERADARRLQPHFIRAFFLEALRGLGGTIRPREPGRFEISHVPGRIREQARLMGLRPGVLRAYERVTFDKDRINPSGLALAAFLCPGHPLLEATIDLLLAQHRDLLRRGAYLVDPSDPSEAPRVLLYLEHTITDQRRTPAGTPSVVSRRLAFVELRADGTAANAGPAPYQDYAPLEPAVRAALAPRIADVGWLAGSVLEERALAYAIEHLARAHLTEVRARTDQRVARTRDAVQARLTYEINYWDHRATQLAAAEQAGKVPNLNSAKARARADDLAERLRSRLHELDQEAQLGSQPPLVVGGAIVVPQGLLDRVSGTTTAAPAQPAADAEARRRIEALAMAAVMSAEAARGGAPRDVSADNLGYDIEAHDPQTGRLRFLEVKGRAAGAPTITLTRNELLEALNVPEAWRLVLVTVDGDQVGEPRYLRSPVTREPDYGVVSQNYSIADLVRGPLVEVA